MSCRAASRVRILRDVPVAQAQTAEMSYAAKIVGRTSKVGLPYQELVLCKADEEYEFGDSFGLDFTICWDDDTKRWILKGHNEHLCFWVDGKDYLPLSCCVLDHESVVEAYRESDPKSGLIIDYLFRLLEAEAPAVVVSGGVLTLHGCTLADHHGAGALHVLYGTLIMWSILNIFPAAG